MLLSSSTYRAGDFDANLPGAYGDNITSPESTREITPLLQKLIKVIEEKGPIVAGHSTIATAGTPGAIAVVAQPRPATIGGELGTPVPATSGQSTW